MAARRTTPAASCSGSRTSSSTSTSSSAAGSPGSSRRRTGPARSGSASTPTRLRRSRTGRTVTEIGGLSAAFVADSLTYPAFAQYDGTGTLSIHREATHVLPRRRRLRHPVASTDSRGFGRVTPGAGPDRTLVPEPRGPRRAAARSCSAGGSPSQARPRSTRRRIPAGPAARSSSSRPATPSRTDRDEGRQGDRRRCDRGRRRRRAGSSSTRKTNDGARSSPPLNAADGIFLTAPDPSTVLALARGEAPGHRPDRRPLGQRRGAAGERCGRVGDQPRSFTTDPRPAGHDGSDRSRGDRRVPARQHDGRRRASAGSTSPSSRGSSRIATGAGSTTSSRSRRPRRGSRSGSMPAPRSSSGPEWSAPLVVGDSVAVVLDGRYASFGVGIERCARRRTG